MGLFSTLGALLGFYAALTAVLAGRLGGGGHFSEFLAELDANRVYLVAGMLTGPLFGAAGAWVGRHHPGTVEILVGSLVASEILVVALVQGHQLLPAPLYFSWSVDEWRPYVAESALGLAVLLIGLWRRRPQVLSI
jgi:hypothetical protein